MDYIFNRPSLHKCLYCKQGLNGEKWYSSWAGGHEHHYKVIHCEKCKRKNWGRVNFPGSGHDSVLKGLSPLESTVRKVWEK